MQNLRIRSGVLGTGPRGASFMTEIEGLMRGRVAANEPRAAKPVPAKPVAPGNPFLTAASAHPPPPQQQQSASGGGNPFLTAPAAATVLHGDDEDGFDPFQQAPPTRVQDEVGRCVVFSLAAFS